MSLDNILKDVGLEAGELFGGEAALAEKQKSQRLQGEARQRLAAAMAQIYASPEGVLLFEYLAQVVRQFFNVSAQGLRMDTAVQFHAALDGKRDLVEDLFRLVKEGQNPPAQKTEA